MSIRKKIIIMCVSLAVVGIFVLVGVLQLIGKKHIESVEREEFEKDINRIVKAVKFQEDQVDALVEDWAAWDEWFSDEADAIVDRYLSANWFRQQKIDFFFLGTENGPVLSYIYDDKDYGIKRSDPENNIILQKIVAKLKKKGKVSSSGIIVMPQGAAVFSASQISDADKKRQGESYLVMGRSLGSDPSKMITWIVDGSLSLEIQYSFGNKKAETSIATVLKNDMRNNYAEIRIDDFLEGAVAILKFGQPRTYYIRSYSLLKNVGIVLIGLALFNSFWIYLLIDGYILQRLEKLIKYMKNTNGFSNLQKPELGGNDEISLIGSQLHCLLVRLKSIYQKVKLLGEYDPLTGCFNRLSYKVDSMERADMKNTPLGIITCDIDGLKLINDTLGHSKGDEVIKHFVDLMSLELGEGKLYRIGGDEFVIAMVNVGLEAMHQMADSIRDKTAEVCLIGGLPCGMSIGVAYGVCEKENELLVAADQKMYSEKLERKKDNHCDAVFALKQLIYDRKIVNEKSKKILSNTMRELAKTVADKSVQLHLEERIDLFLEFHDVGGITLSKLNFNHDEFLIKRHCETGYRIARNVLSLQMIADEILYHHEQWEGKGGPFGLKGEAIPVLVRVFAVAEKFYEGYMLTRNKSGANQYVKKYSYSQLDPYFVRQLHVVFESVSMD